VAGAAKLRFMITQQQRRRGLWLAGTVLAVLGGAIVFGRFERMMIFPATREIYRDPGAFDWAFDDVVLPVAGHESHGWWIPLEKARGVVLFSHGNAGNIADRLESIGLLRKLGFSVLAYDYGGYGRSTGAASEKRCHADSRAFWHYLIEDRRLDPSEILLFGRSLGGAVTCDLATEVTPRAVIIESTFTSVPDIARELVPLFPARLLLKTQFANKDKISQINAPLLLVHSRDDTLIPFHHGEELFQRAPEPKTFVEIRGDHNDGFVISHDIYLAAWEAFLQPLFPP
jgi:pimeloyl-ACP methyl ester carboxylesterase